MGGDVLNAAFIKAFSEMLAKGRTKAESSSALRKGANTADTPLDVEELLGKSQRRQDAQNFEDASAARAPAQTSGFKGILNNEIRATLSGPLNQRLKIAVLHRNFDPSGGGAEHYAAALVEELAQLHEFHVFAQRIAHAHPGVTYHRVSQWFVRPRWLNQLVFAGVCAWKTRRSQGFDIVHSHENTWSANVHTVHVMPMTHNLFAGKTSFQKALVWLKVILSPRLLTYVCLEHFRLSNAPGKWFIAVSEPLNTLLKYSAGCNPESLLTIAPGVHAGPPLSAGARALERAKARERTGLPEHARCLLWVGHDAQKKGLGTALQALALLPSDYVLIIAGAAKPRSYWQHWVDGSISHRILEKGVLGAKELEDLYRACDLLIHPTKEDTYGMVVLEAMAQGLAVIVSGVQYCGISADLRDQETALILNSPEDPAELAGKIVLALQGLLGEQLSAKAIEWARTQDWSHRAELQNTVYLHTARVRIGKRASGFNSNSPR